jgi:hypothetical protein
METSKQAVNARKAGLDKHLAKGELNEFLDEFFIGPNRNHRRKPGVFFIISH